MTMTTQNTPDPASFSSALDDPLSDGQRPGPSVFVVFAGGTGTKVGHRMFPVLGHHPGCECMYVDTKEPEGEPAHRCVRLRPGDLPRVPTASMDAWRAMTGLTVVQYQHYVEMVGPGGICQLPSMGLIAAGMQFDEIARAIENGFAACERRRRGGATGQWLVTVASGAGGTGAPTARIAGLAARHVTRGKARWLHVLVASPLLGDAVRTRRTLALEHAQFRELRALMRPGASLSVPRIQQPIACPGPDHLVVLSSDSGAPRVLEQATDELTAMLVNWLS